jgi:hypothetical protein
MLENVKELTLAQLKQLLLALEHSMETPVARRYGKKSCRYCASYMEHDPLCTLNHALIRLIAGEDTPELKAEIIIVLRDMMLIGPGGGFYFMSFINTLIA